MREQVVAWSREMADFLRVPIATVAIAINLFDRFVECHRVGKNVLYALTAACVLIACKQMVDFEVPVDVIARRASTNRADIALLEPLVLNALQWRVNVVTAYEVCVELGKKFAHVTKRGTLLDTLVLNCLMDVDMAWVRATSVGVACFIVTSLFLAKHSSHRQHAVYAYARWCGVDMAQVDYCVERLQASIACMFDGVEDDEGQQEEEEEEEEEDQQRQLNVLGGKGGVWAEGSVGGARGGLARIELRGL
ncbi:G2/mitotic-specific cyclin-2 [Gracilariopsis chorda]|uniref:G2/mitotic-specific cyclin-2 n=1 Tax=Gracilariopsis chorda TaxID=448386 RepID=A0A2V3IJN3_9FLOR|nr:G2/mitotic-specific cyclin-2 [Gracilariopsis chorda]|eukprot:PXF42258.1 G2/mitotic-specific cyclin-2 [Gracilariopsis chorda]